MLNQAILVGRLVSDPEIKETENNRKVCYLQIAVPRSFKNTEGQYDTDFINCTLWDSVASNTCEYCHKGDIVGIKCRIQTKATDNEDGTKEYKMEIIAEKVTFLSSKKEGNNNE